MIDKKSILILILLFGFGIFVLVSFGDIVSILKEHEKTEKTNLKPCQHWVYNYRMMGRHQRVVMCGTDTMLNEAGRYRKLPENLKSLEESIQSQYNYLMSVKETARRR